MIRFVFLLLFIFISGCFRKPDLKVSNEFINITGDSLQVYITQPDSFQKISQSKHFIHFWWGNLKPVPAQLISELTNAENIIQTVSNEMNWKIPNKKISVNWYPTPELKTFKSGESEFDSKKENEVYHVWNSDLPHSSFSPETNLIFNEQLSKIKNAKLKKAFVEFIMKSGKKDSLNSGLFKLEDLPSLQEITNPESSWANEKILSLAAISDFFFSLGKTKELYQILISVSENGQNIPEQWELLWQQRKVAAKDFLFKNPENLKIHGFNFTNEGYRIFNGYLSEAAKKSVMKLKAENSNTIALIPFGFMSSATETKLFWANQSGSENDESIIYAGTNAKKAGLQVMIKPQLWLRWGTWCGEIEMKNTADWEAFENEYRIWILHYAAIAQKFNFEFLSIGVELLKFTKNRPQFFISLISDIRKIYGGRITYSANWYGEADEIQFWDKLDFIGINCYYPLSENENADASDLKNEAENLAGRFSLLSEKWSRKIVFTEIGFARNLCPWVMPHDERKNKIFSESEQAICYRVALEKWQHQSWNGGFLWWKWSSGYDMMNDERIDFFPGKPARNIAAEMFKE